VFDLPRILEPEVLPLQGQGQVRLGHDEARGADLQEVLQMLHVQRQGQGAQVDLAVLRPCRCVPDVLETPAQRTPGDRKVHILRRRGRVEDVLQLPRNENRRLHALPSRKGQPRGRGETPRRRIQAPLRGKAATFEDPVSDAPDNPETPAIGPTQGPESTRLTPRRRVKHPTLSGACSPMSVACSTRRVVVVVACSTRRVVNR